MRWWVCTSRRTDRRTGGDAEVIICNLLWVRPYLPFFLPHLEPHSKPRKMQSVSLSQWFRIHNEDILPWITKSYKIIDKVNLRLNWVWRNEKSSGQRNYHARAAPHGGDIRKAPSQRHPTIPCRTVIRHPTVAFVELEKTRTPCWSNVHPNTNCGKQDSNQLWATSTPLQRWCMIRLSPHDPRHNDQEKDMHYAIAMTFHTIWIMHWHVVFKQGGFFEEKIYGGAGARTLWRGVR